jgi:hypothetical protein
MCSLGGYCLYKHARADKAAPYEQFEADAPAAASAGSGAAKGRDVELAEQGGDGGDSSGR